MNWENYSAVTGQGRKIDGGKQVYPVTITHIPSGVVRSDNFTVSVGNTVQETGANLWAAVRSAILAFDAARSAQSVNLIPANTTLDLSDPVPVVVPPTQAEIDRAAFFADYNTERTAQILATLSPGLQSRYKSEYGGLR